MHIDFDIWILQTGYTCNTVFCDLYCFFLFCNYTELYCVSIVTSSICICLSFHSFNFCICFSTSVFILNLSEQMYKHFTYVTYKDLLLFDLDKFSILN